MPLTDTAIRAAKAGDKPYKLADGGGLYLLVNPTGSRLWRLKYRIEGKEKLLAIGPYPEVSLAKARERRDDAKKAIVDGADPSALKKRAREEAKAAPVNAFRAVAEEHLAKLTREGLADITLAKRRWLLGFAYPHFGDRDIGAVSSADVLEALREIEAKGHHETARRMRSVKALARYETYTAAKDFRTFRREQAIGFKARLAETEGLRTGEPLSASTQATTLMVLKDFFTWLSWQPGFKSKVHMADIDYLSPSNKDAARAKAAKLRAFPSLEQVRATLTAMPGETVIDRRNRALVAFTLLTGIRDRALVSLSLGHVDTSGKTPVVAQDPNSVETKFAKAIVTYFFPVGDDLAAIALAWIEELRKVHLFGPADPLFPRTRMGLGDDGGFAPVGIEREHWSNASPVREIFRKAFERAGLPYFPPHAFRHTLGHLAQTMCRTPEELKAWSQNLGHENIATTLTSYGRIDPHRQGEVMGRMGREADADAGDVLAQIGALLARKGQPAFK